MQQDKPRASGGGTRGGSLVPPGTTEFRGLGADPETRRRLGEPIRQMEEDFAKVFQKPEDQRRYLEAHCRSAWGPIRHHQAAKDQVFFKLVGEKIDKSGKVLSNPTALDYNAGFYVTEEQYAVLRKNPEAIEHVLLALPQKTRSDAGRYDVYRVVVTDSRSAHYYTSVLAPTKESLAPGQADLYQMGGYLRIYCKDPGTGEHYVLPNQQVHILNGAGFSESERLDDPLIVPRKVALPRGPGRTVKLELVSGGGRQQQGKPGTGRGKPAKTTADKPSLSLVKTTLEGPPQTVLAKPEETSKAPTSAQKPPVVLPAPAAKPGTKKPKRPKI